MPNIFKRFLQPNASDFVFPDVEELVEEEPADTAGEQEGEPEESAPEAEEKDTPSAVDFAQIQAEKILEDARRQAEDYLVRRQMEAEQEAEQVRQQAQSEGYRRAMQKGCGRPGSRARQSCEAAGAAGRGVAGFFGKGYRRPGGAAAGDAGRAV